MPKFYCDYCDIYLAHSSIGGRRQHCIGRKHIQNKIDYYQRVLREEGLVSMAPMPPFGQIPGGPPPMPMPFLAGMPPPPFMKMPPGDPAHTFSMIHAMMSMQGRPVVP